MADCIFCGAPAKSKEHFWGAWLQGIYDIDPNGYGHTVHKHDYRDENGNIQIKKGWGAGGGAYANKTIGKMVCEQCNNGWMNTIQSRMREVYLRLIEEQNALSPEDQTAIKNWFGLKVLLHQARATRDGDALRADQAYLRVKVEEERRANRSQFMHHQELPSDWHIYVSRQPHPQVPGIPDYFGVAMEGGGQVRELLSMTFYVFELQATITNLHLRDSGCNSHLLDTEGRIIQLTGEPVSFPSRPLDQLIFQKMVLQPVRALDPDARDSIFRYEAQKTNPASK